MADGTVVTASAPGDARLDSRQPVSTRATNRPELFRHRSEFAALSGGLLQMDADLMQSKVVESKAMKADTTNTAPSKSKTGWSDGAAEVAEIMANDAQREATGGIARTDASRYTVTPRCPTGAVT